MKLNEVSLAIMTCECKQIYFHFFQTTISKGFFHDEFESHENNRKILKKILVGFSAILYINLFSLQFHVVLKNSEAISEIPLGLTKSNFVMILNRFLDDSTVIQLVILRVISNKNSGRLNFHSDIYSRFFGTISECMHK